MESDICGQEKALRAAFLDDMIRSVATRTQKAPDIKQNPNHPRQMICRFSSLPSQHGFFLWHFKEVKLM